MVEQEIEEQSKMTGESENGNYDYEIAMDEEMGKKEANPCVSDVEKATENKTKQIVRMQFVSQCTRMPFRSSSFIHLEAHICECKKDMHGIVVVLVGVCYFDGCINCSLQSTRMGGRNRVHVIISFCNYIGA